MDGLEAEGALDTLRLTDLEEVEPRLALRASQRVADDVEVAGMRGNGAGPPDGDALMARVLDGQVDRGDVVADELPATVARVARRQRGRRHRHEVGHVEGALHPSVVRHRVALGVDVPEAAVGAVEVVQVVVDVDHHADTLLAQPRDGLAPHPVQRSLDHQHIREVAGADEDLAVEHRHGHRRHLTGREQHDVVTERLERLRGPREPVVAFQPQPPRSAGYT